MKYVYTVIAILVVLTWASLVTDSQTYWEEVGPRWSGLYQSSPVD